MKNLFLIIIAILSVTIISCEDEDLPKPQTQVNEKTDGGDDAEDPGIK